LERKILAPEKETLDETEASIWLNVKVGVFRSLVKRGCLPPGMPFGPRTLRWHWMDLVAYTHLLSRGCFKIQAEEETGE
jgi:hypothetical protein